MFDIKWIRDEPDAFNKAMQRRGLEVTSQELLALDEERRDVVQSLQEAQAKRNASSKDIGKAMAQGDGARAEALKSEVATLKNSIQQGEERERRLDQAVRKRLSELPNAPLDETPDGLGEDDNVEIRRIGVQPQFDFEPREHFELGEALGLMDFEAAARMSGSRFVVLKGGLARLERAIGQFMLDVQTSENGYQEVAPPLLVRDEAMFGTGQLPKFAEDLFHTEDARWLVPTAEVPLTNLVREQILNEDELPKRVTALTPCFRAEAGAAGRDTRGMIRQHQFSKVELVSITGPDQSRAELDRMTGCAEAVLQKLGLHYRVMALCTGDMGFGAQLTYDIEVWLPGQSAFREISSCSVCGDFQARRMNARFRRDGQKGTQFVHTLNGSGLAVGRCLIAVMENYQTADGSIILPDALRPYMGGAERIETT